MYNAVKTCEVILYDKGYAEFSRIFVIPRHLKNFSFEYVFFNLCPTQSEYQENLIAVKYMELSNIILRPTLGLRPLKKNHKVLKETNWYLSLFYSDIGLGEIHKLAEPSLLLSGDLRNAKYRINYFVDLRTKGYSKEEAFDMVFS